MRNMSFALTERQLLDGLKTVTRRLGWKFLKPGDKVRAVRKAMGLKKGEKMVPLGVCTILNVRREPLQQLQEYTCPNEEVAGEGFPGMLWYEFIGMFCRHMKCSPDTEITRIEFEFEPLELATKGEA